jgi:hypothetical protein
MGSIKNVLQPLNQLLRGLKMVLPSTFCGQEASDILELPSDEEVCNYDSGSDTNISKSGVLLLQ